MFDDGAVDQLQGASGLNWDFARRSGTAADVLPGLLDTEIVEDLGS